MDKSRARPSVAARTLLVVLSLLGAMLGAIAPAHAAGEQVVMGMPFTGKWAYNVLTNANCGTTAHPSCHDISSSGYQWAVDYYNPNGSDVRLYGASAQGTVTFQTSGATQRSCGQSVTVSVRVNGVQVGMLYITHMQNIVVSSTIANGGTVGQVYSATCQQTYSHVHFEYKNTAGNNACYVDYSNASHKAGMVVAAGDAVGVIGSTNTGIRQVCAGLPNTNPPGPTPVPVPVMDRVVARVGSSLYTTTSQNIPWSLASNTAAAGNWKLSGNRIGLLDSNGLWVRDGDGAWNRWGGSDTQEFQVSSDRVVARVGNLLYTTTAPNIPWALISNTAAAGNWKLSGNRIGLLDSNGLWVRDGDSSWIRWGGSDTQEFAVSPDRVVARVGNALFATTSHAVPWSLVSNTASAGNWKLSGNRLGLLDSNGLWVSDNGGAFVRWGGSDTQEFQVSSDRVVARVGNLLYTTATSTVAWSLISNTASAGNWKLSGNRIGLLDSNGLWVRDGDASWNRWGGSDTQEFAIA